MKKLSLLLLIGCIVFSSCSPNEPSNPIDPDSPSVTTTYTVSFNSNGGTNIDSQIVNEGSKINKPTNPTREGYTFVSWLYESEVWNFDNPVTSDLTLIASWRINTYKITYMLQGGINNPLNPTNYTVEDNITLEDPSRIGYSFSGWRYHNEIISIIPKGTTGDITLVANWTINSYEVQINTDTKQGVVTGSGTYEYDSLVTINVTPNPGYEFVGLFIGEQNISSDLTYSFNMPADNIIFEAKFNVITYTITYELDGGINHSDNPTTYTVEDVPSLKQATKDEYRFVSWTLNGEEITSLQGITGNITLVANWSKLYLVSVVYDDTTGRVSGDGLYAAGEIVKLIADPNPGYEVTNWYINDKEAGSHANIYSFVMPSNDVVCEVRWDIGVYTITYDLNGGVLPEGTSNPTTYTYNDEILLVSPTKTGYEFKGWECNGQIITKIETGTYGNLLLKAKFDYLRYEVRVDCYEAGRGEIIGNDYYVYNQAVVLKANPHEGYNFRGWYNLNKELVSKENPYTFSMPSESVYLKALFLTETEEQWNYDHGIFPKINLEDNTVTYGMYPQTVVNESMVSILNNLTSESIDPATGWYKYGSGYYCRTTDSILFSDTYYFSNGERIYFDKTYWFICEPIVWNILSINQNTYVLTSKTILERMYYHLNHDERTINGTTIYPNNYKYSDVRAWLNGYDGSTYGASNYKNKGFINIAFNYSFNNLVNKTIDNTPYSTGSSTNTYACEDTSDKVFLPSYVEATSNLYFSEAIRKCKTTDYVLVNWARKEDGYGYYYTRSPNSGDAIKVAAINYNGKAIVDDNDKYYHSIRPCINIEIR